MVGEAEAIYAELLAAAAVYSWPYLKIAARDWLLARVRRGVQAATVRLEEWVETVAEAAAAAAARLSPAGAARTPAPALLKQLQRNLSGQALKLFQVNIYC